MLLKLDRSKLSFLTLLAALLPLLQACDRSPESAPPATAGAEGQPGEPDASVAAQPEAPLTVADLAPVIRTTGGDSPARIMVEFATAVVLPEAVDKDLTNAAGGTRLGIDPSAEGRLRFTTPSTLSFVPAAGFVPGTRYEVALEAVETRSGLLKAPLPNPWTYRFDTPSFGFTRLSAQSLDSEHSRAEVVLVFSAPVDLAEVTSRARFRLRTAKGETAISKVRLELNSQPAGVRAVLTESGIGPDASILLDLAAGVPAAGRPELVAAAAHADVTFAQGSPMEIRDVGFAEGTSGYFVDVVCNDSAVADKRYYWDRTREIGYGELSARCSLRESDARSGIHIDPPLEFSVTPAGGGARLFADFKRGSYTLRIDAGVRTLDGGVLNSDYETSFTIPARSPAISFVSKGRYLPKAAWRSLAVRHRNLKSGTLTARLVRPESLVFWMSNESGEVADDRTSDLVALRTIPLESAPDELRTTWVDVSALLPETTRGLIELTLAAAGSQDTTRLVLTDLHLIAKRATPAPGARGGEVAVWALDSRSLEPARGVTAKLVRKSGFEMATCVTGSDGGCRLALEGAADLDPSPPFAIIASKGHDLTYLKFEDLKTEIQEARVAGEPYRGDRKYRASVFSERGVYRPGETAHLVGIVRGADNLAPEAEMPVVAQLRDPRGTVLRKLSLKLNAAGIVTLDQSFPAFATTGRYELALDVAGRRIGQHSFLVEEFVPERMKVEAHPVGGEALLGAAVDFTVDARYLFGGVPADHRVELGCEIEPASFEPRENASFHYGVWNEEDSPARPLALGSVSGALDADGSARLTCPGGAVALGFKGPARLVARAAVFEGGSGRTSVAESRLAVHPERYYIGLESGSKKVAAGSDVNISGIVVDWEGRAVPLERPIEIEFVRLESEWGYRFDPALGYESYKRYLRTLPMGKASAQPDAAGRFKLSWRPTQDAEGFVVRARAGGARTDLELEGSDDWYYWGPNQTEVDQTPRPDKPTWLALDLPETAKVGDSVTLTLKAPYRGRLLVTVETDHLIESSWTSVQAGDVSHSFRIASFEPNVYVSAFLIKDPHLDSAEAFLPDRAFGVGSITLEPTEFTDSLALSVPAEVRSNSRLEVRLELGARSEPTWAVVAAVDEGILSLTRFESPDPLKAIFARRALGVDTFETVGWTLPVPAGGPAGTQAGDEAGADLGRVPAVKPVALWSGLVEVPADGKLSVGFDVPQYRGKLRVMAVTAGARRVGHAEAGVIVRDPLVVQSTLPRFLLAGDEFQLPVFVTNLSGTRRDVSVALEIEVLPVPGLKPAPGDEARAPVTVVGQSVRTLGLADTEGGVAVFRARTLAQVGAARLRVTARSGDVTSIEELDVPILPAGPKSRSVERVEIEPGTTELAPRLEGWLPLSERSTIWVTANPYGDAFDHLRHLVRYPYGCLEQTTSSLRPLLFVSNILNNVDPTLLASGKLEDMVKHGVDRLFSMQTPSGGFAYWAGGTEPAYWGTAYATHILMEAAELRYQVSPERTSDALDWMDRQIADTFERGRTEASWYSSNSEPYFHYVLARAGRAHKARIEKLIASPMPTGSANEQREQLYLLKAALYLAGDRRYEVDLRQPDLSPVVELRDNSWSFYSDRRMRGLMLSTYVDLFGADERGGELARLVAESLRSHPSYWYTTQELAWSVTGLGKFVESGARAFEPPDLFADGRRLEPELTPAGRTASDRTWSLARASEYDALSLKLPTKGEGKLWVIVSSEGVREKPDVRYGGKGLMLTRRHLDAEGKPLALTGVEHALGDVVYVELTIKNTTAERIANVALVDRIPAGWEIENPRLGRGGDVEWIDRDTLWQADMLNVRDDRLEVFGHLEEGKTERIVYAVRAVTAGSFTLPAAEAEAMYDPSIWARVEGGNVTIGGPWAGLLN